MYPIFENDFKFQYSSCGFQCFQDTLTSAPLIKSNCSLCWTLYVVILQTVILDFILLRQVWR